MASFRNVVAVAIIAGAACLKAAPPTQELALGNPACVGTKMGAACLTLNFSVSASMLSSSASRCKGYLHWGLYKGGDVELTGPGNNPSIRGGTIAGVDLSVAGASFPVTIPDIPAGSYQALGFMSQSEDASAAVPGDPVTFPSGSFDVPANKETEVSVVFDWLR